jgi:hypothetical protein
MIDLVLGDMKPPPVGIHCGSSAERPLQPRIIASSKALERDTAYFAELANVVLERLPAKETAPLCAKCQGRLPRRLLLRRGCSLLEGETLIATLRHSDVSQERANRVAGAVLQMIELRHAQSFDCGKRGLARVE